MITEIVQFLNQFSMTWFKWVSGISYQVILLVGMVGILSLLAHRARASFRYCLWLIVLVKLVLPPSVHLATGIGNWGLSGAYLSEPPVFSSEKVLPSRIALPALPVKGESLTPTMTIDTHFTGLTINTIQAQLSWPAVLLIIWAAGVLALTLLVTIRFFWFRRKLRNAQGVKNPQCLQLLNQAREKLNIKKQVRIVAGNFIRVPALTGIIKPVLLIPEGLENKLRQEELYAIFLHELAHLKRYDIIISWLQTVIQAIYWFHPLIWLVNHFINREREIACNDIAIVNQYKNPKSYGESILKVLQFSAGRPLGSLGFMGIAEGTGNLQSRFYKIIKGSHKVRLTLPFILALVIAAVIFVPMGTKAQNPAGKKYDEVEKYYAGLDETTKQYLRRSNETFVKQGLYLAEDAFASLSAIELQQKENEWLPYLKGPKNMAQWQAIESLGAIKSKQAVRDLLTIATEMKIVDNRSRWLAVRALGRIGDDRVVPELIHLLDHYNENTRMWARASLYRLTGKDLSASKEAWGNWWNSTGKWPLFIAGKKYLAPEEVTLPVSAPQQAPRVVDTSPMRGQKDVDPGIKEITVTFDQDMGGGFSWTGGGELYPKTTGRPFWRDKRTCVLPVQLEPGKFYRVGINSKSHRNFRGANGQAAEVTAIHFATKGAPPASSQYLEPPQVIRMEPANGSENVNPDIKEIKVTFNQEMGGGFSWTGGGEQYPETTDRPYWTADRKTCVLPVRLKPNWEYSLGLNSFSHKNFQSKFGVPLEPVHYRFKTGQRR